jgi:deoxyribose-phosphate aldolase
VFARREDLAVLLDATLLRPDAGDEEAVKLAGQARRDGCAAVCVAPRRLPAAARTLQASGTFLAATVSFPAGDSTLASKIFTALEALRLGAHELEVVCDLDSIRRGDMDALEKEMGERWP